MPGRTYITSEEALFVFHHPGWTVGLEMREGVELAIRDALESELSSYFDRLERVAVARGYRPPEPSRARPKEKGAGGRDRHYRWLARWQVLGVSAATLAREAGVEKRTVERALKETAKVIGLPRRSEAARTRRQPRPRAYRRGPRH